MGTQLEVQALVVNNQPNMNLQYWDIFGGGVSRYLAMAGLVSIKNDIINKKYECKCNY